MNNLLMRIQLLTAYLSMLANLWMFATYLVKKEDGLCCISGMRSFYECFDICIFFPDWNFSQLESNVSNMDPG